MKTNKKLREFLENVEPVSFEVSESDESVKAFKKIERLISLRDRSVHEISKRLLQDDYSQAATEHAIQRALRCGYLDDARFARTLIMSRLSQGKGLAGLYRELDSHQIDRSFLDDYLEDHPVVVDEQTQRALEVLKRKPTRSKNKFQGAYLKLIRLGYSSSVAMQATKQWLKL